MISENQERFVQMLNDPNQGQSGQSGGGGGGQQGVLGAGGFGGPAMEQGNFIQVTPEEKQAIERVSGLSFSPVGSLLEQCI